MIKHERDHETEKIRRENQRILRRLKIMAKIYVAVAIVGIIGIFLLTVSVLVLLWTTASNMQPPPQPAQTQSTYQVPPNQQPAAGF